MTRSMTRATTFAALALASAVLTPVVVVGAGTASAPAPAANAVANAAPMAQAAAAPASSLEATCPRRVKVIYAGYGEGQNPRCAAPVEAKR